MMPNFTCSWNDATANRTTVADWSNCNGTDPNNGGGNTYDATIATGDPTLTTAITIGSVTITSPGAWTLSGSSASAVLTGTLANSGDLELHKKVSLRTGGNLTNSGALNLDTVHLEGGSSLATGGTLNNSTTIDVGLGDHSLTANSTVSAAALGQVGTINLDGVIGGAQAALKIATGPVTITSADDVGLHDNALFSLASGNLTNSGALNLDTGHPMAAAASTSAPAITVLPPTPR